jgi:glycosyltransferase involved in cell wall biosynthesis
MQTLPRIFHGPENICGIGRNLADWQRDQKNAKSDFIVFKDKTNRQNSHKNLRFDESNLINRLIQQVWFLRAALKNYDIFHFYFGKSLLPLNLDLPILRLAGKSILMTYVGTDIRLEKVEKQRNPYYHLRKPKNKISDLVKRTKMMWHGIWCNYCLVGVRLAIYAQTSIPDRKIIKDIWVTKTIDLPSDPPKFSDKKKPVIVHAPSNYHTKGTYYIQNAINALKEEGLDFEFKIFHKVPHDTFINFLKNEADIVVDQLLSGGYGTLSMEGMTYSKPVCCYINEDIWAQIPDLPIIQSTIDSLQSNLRDLILNPEKREQIGREGWKFARNHFDRDIVGEKLWQIYLDLWNKKK